MKVSAVWIAKNAADDLVRSIHSVRKAADELLVVDTGSTDDTAEKARQAGARVAACAWNNDFAAARNFALGQAGGDVILFLDADEWFEPALAATDREALETLFANTRLSAMSVTRTDVDPELGAVIAVGESPRILRGGAVCYQGRIHEQLAPAPGAPWGGSGHMPAWNLHHSGYRRATTAAKRLRNRNMLQQALDSAENDEEKALYHLYMMREMFSLQKETAFQSLDWLLNHPAQTERLLQTHADVGKTLLFDGIRLAAECREKVSRQQVRRVLVQAGQKCYPKDPLCVSLPLYYELCFDNLQGRLLQKWPAAAEKAEALRGGATAGMDDYLRGNVDLYTAAGQAAWRRGNRELAFDCAAKALTQEVAVFREQAIKLFLRCVKGLPGQDVILFLERVAGAGRRGMMEALLRHCQYEGFAEVYTYFMKKQLDAGWATKGDFWYLLVLLGRCEEAIAMTLAAREGTEENLVRQTLFLAILCSGKEELLRRYRKELGEYGPVLELYFYAETGGEVNFGIVAATYQRIAFAAGRQAANRLLRAVRGMEWQGFLVQSTYYMDGGFYAELLEDSAYTPEAGDAAGIHRLAECEIMSGRYGEALARLRALPAQAPVGEEWLNLLDAIGARAPREAAGMQAARLWAQMQHEYEEWVEARDVDNTGLVFAADSKKGRRALAEMTPEALDDMVQAADGPAFAGQVPVLHAAADVYRENKCYEAALGCYLRVWGHAAATAETYGGLAQLFAKLENEHLARLMWQKAKMT